MGDHGYVSIYKRLKVQEIAKRDKQAALDEAWQLVLNNNEEREFRDNQLSLFDVESEL